MVRPPYWVAARVFAATATRTGKARIAGAYTLNNGRDIDDLPPDLYLNVVEAWLWDHFGTQDQADKWLESLEPLPVLIFGHAKAIDFDARACFLRAAVVVADRLTAAARAGTDVVVEDVPPGWESDTLLAHSRMVGTLIE